MKVQDGWYKYYGLFNNKFIISRRILFDFEEIHVYKKRYIKLKKREVRAVL